MDVLDRIGKAGLVPVVVIDKAEDAVPAARALLDGGLDVMEITMRTPAGVQAIREVSRACPEMLTGAGTVLTLDKAKECADSGARFIVAPGFNPEIVEWCLSNSLPVTPGCVTPTEIERALSYGLKVLKYFPADVYGGVKGMKALHGPYGPAGVTFIPTGGISNDNLADYADKPFVHAVGGGWLCSSGDIGRGDFGAITAGVKTAVDILLGFEFAHLGINAGSPEESLNLAETFSGAFGFPVKPGNSSDFAGTGIEITKTPGLGTHGHIAVRTNSIPRAVHYLEKRGYSADPETAKYKGSALIAVYLTKKTGGAAEFGGFAVHLLQK